MRLQQARAKFMYTVPFLLLAQISVCAQGTPVTEGPLNVTIPAGWTGKKLPLPGERKRFFSPESTASEFFAVSLLSRETSDDLVTFHNSVITNLSGIIAPGTTPQTGTLGRFLWTRVTVLLPGSQRKPKTLILYGTKVGSTYVGADVEAANDDLLAKNLPAVEGMLRSAVIANSQVTTPRSLPPAPQSAGQLDTQPATDMMATQPFTSSPVDRSTTVQMPTGPASLGEYVYAVPPGWTQKQDPRFVSLFSSVSATGEQCQITMFPLQPSSGDLMKDALVGFQQVFTGWEPRSQTSYGPLDTSLIRGISGAGWNYVIVKKGIGRHGPYESLMGSLMAAQLNNALALILTISKDPLVSTCLGQNLADAWPDFFYSLGFKSWFVPPHTAAAMKQALVGTWTAATATASDQFTFAANGRYGGASAAQHYNLAGNDTVVSTTQAFFGDGAYSLQGNTITFIPDDRNRPRNSGHVRVEQESRDGGRTWKPILHVLRISSVDGKEYEVGYEKTGN